jgi:glycosyltransferase involved in cell wall biosynthesis
MPEYDRESGGQSIFDLIMYLRDAGWAVSFAPQNPANGVRYARLLEQRGVATYDGFNERLDELIKYGRLDLAIFAFWYIGEELIPRVREWSPATHVAVNTMDLHFLRNARRILGRRNGNDPSALDDDYASEFARELNTYASADAVFAVSPKEADLINDLVGDPLLAHVVSDYEPSPTSRVAFSARHGILFVGNFRHPPNAEAVEYLCTEIVPRLDPKILDDHPVYIVGNDLDDRIRAFGRGLPNVRMVGWVPTLMPYLERAAVAVIPLLHGAGTKRKLLQALMAGIPTVSTHVGVEGFELRQGTEVLVADDPAAFADEVKRVLTDEPLWRRLSRSGQRKVAPDHSREAVQARFLVVLDSVMAREQKGARVERTSGENRSYADKSLYKDLVKRVQEVVETATPEGSTVAVVSKGDESLVQLEGRRGWHFPTANGGAYAGNYPADTVAAIASLEALKRDGAEYVVFPSTALWWLEHYEGLDEHLARNCREVAREEGICLIYGLT